MKNVLYQQNYSAFKKEEVSSIDQGGIKVRESSQELLTPNVECLLTNFRVF